MSYVLVRDGLLAVLKTVTGFSATNVAYEDFQILNAGLLRGIVVEYGNFAQDYNAFNGQIWADWELTVNLFNEFADIVAAQTEQDADRDSIIQKLRTYPQLNGTAGVFLAMAKSGQPERNPVELGGARWLKERLTIAVREDVPGVEAE